MKAKGLIFALLLSAALVMGTGCDDGAGCPTGQIECNGACTDVLLDPSNCGTCGNVCSSSQTCCSGLCVDLMTNTSNCGTCGNLCTTGESCVGGSCGSTGSEICNGEDDDGDGDVDEDLSRSCDNPCGRGTETCTGGTWGGCTAPDPVDETCDGEDNDCDGQIDEEVAEVFYRDSDEDGYGDINETTQDCEAPTGYVDNADDCDDEDDTINPEVTEEDPDTDCDGLDNDCDGTIDEICDCTVDEVTECGEGGNEGECEFGTQTCTAEGWEPCEGGVRPAEEECDGLDNDCNGEIDDGLPGDGYEANNSCGESRGPFTIQQEEEATVLSATLYSSDDTQDTDWYLINTRENSPSGFFGGECNFYLDVVFTTPEGASPDEWELCLEDRGGTSADAECSDELVETFCTAAEDWNDETGEFSFTLRWGGTWGRDNGKDFFAVVRPTDGVELNVCQEYSLSFTFYHVDEDECL